MRPSIGEALRTIAEASLPGASISVPREVILELLSDLPSRAVSGSPARDLSVNEVGVHFGRSPTTVRGWLEAGLLPGSYKLRGKAWRVPPAALSHMAAAPRMPPDRPTSTPVVSLAAWRRSA
jgi:hypothetical protein